MTDLPSPIRVVIADDHIIVRAGIVKVLEHAGDIQVVAEAGDGESAKNLIGEHHPDVAVLDIQMPTNIETMRSDQATFQPISVLPMNCRRMRGLAVFCQTIWISCREYMDFAPNRK